MSGISSKGSGASVSPSCGDGGSSGVGSGNSLSSINEKHRVMAQMLSCGVTLSEAARVVGYDRSYAHRLRNDPLFQDLLKFYGKRVETAVEVAVHSMVNLTRSAMSELQRRLDEDPESFTNAELRKLAATFADRTGHGPSSSQEVSISVDLGDRLDAARRRALEARRREVEDAEVMIDGE